MNRSTVFSLLAMMFMVIAQTNVFSQSPNLTFTVSQNPFPVSTNFILQGLSEDTISLKIVDINGQTASSILNNFIANGDLTIPFNAHSLADGIYFAHLVVNSKTITIKLLKNKTLGNVSFYGDISGEPHIYFNSNEKQIIIDRVVPEKGLLELYSLNGQLISSSMLSSTQTRIPLSNVSKGIYFYQIKTIDRVIDSGKVVLN